MLQKIEDLEMETNAMRNELFILWNKAISATNNPADNNVRVLNHTCFMKGQRNCKIKCNLVYGKLSEMMGVSPLTAAKGTFKYDAIKRCQPLVWGNMTPDDASVETGVGGQAKYDMMMVFCGNALQTHHKTLKIIYKEVS